MPDSLENQTDGFARHWMLAGQYIRDVAHDVNNQLGAVLAYAELASLDAGGQPEMKQSLREIVGAAERSSRILDALAALVGRQPSSVEQVDFADVTLNVLLLFQRRKDRDQIHLDIAVPEHSTPINAIHSELARLVAHALQWAIDRLTANPPPRMLRIEFQMVDGLQSLRIAGTPKFDAGTETDDGSLNEVIQYARHHRGDVAVHSDALVITIPKDTGLREA